MFEKGREEEMLDLMSHCWEYLTNDQVYKDWFGGPVEGILEQHGIYDNSPLVEYMSNLFEKHGKPNKKKWTVAAVDVNSGTYVNFDETVDSFPKAVVSSASIPAVFPPQVWP